MKHELVLLHRGWIKIKYATERKREKELSIHHATHTKRVFVLFYIFSTLPNMFLIASFARFAPVYLSFGLSSGPQTR